MRIIFKNIDSTLGIIRPSPEHLSMFKDENDAIQVLINKVVPKPVEIFDVPTGITSTDENGDEFEEMESRVFEYEYEVVADSEIPSDRTFRSAWVKGDVKGMGSARGIKVHIPKAKLIAHAHRRIERDRLFIPLDVQATIPAQAVQAEKARQVIRDKDTSKQSAINNAVDVDSLKEAMNIVL